MWVSMVYSLLKPKLGPLGEKGKNLHVEVEEVVVVEEGTGTKSTNTNPTSPSGSRANLHLGRNIYGSQPFSASKASQNSVHQIPPQQCHCPMLQTGPPWPCFGGAFRRVAGASPATWSPGGRGKHFPSISCLLIFSAALAATASEKQRRSRAPASPQLQHSLGQHAGKITPWGRSGSTSK